MRKNIRERRTGVRRGAAAAIAVGAVAASALLGASPAMAQATAQITYVPSAIDYSGLGPQGGDITVTWTLAPHKTLDPGCGTPVESFSATYTISPQQPTNAWASTPEITFVSPRVQTDTVVQGTSSVELIVDQHHTGKLAANTGWTPRSLSAGYFDLIDWSLTDGAVPATSPYVANTNFVPTSVFTISSTDSVPTNLGMANAALDPSSAAPGTWSLALGGWRNVNTADKTIVGFASNHLMEAPGPQTAPATQTVETAVGNARGSSFDSTAGQLTFTPSPVVENLTCVADTPLVDGGVAAAAGVLGVGAFGAAVLVRRRKGAADA